MQSIQLLFFIFIPTFNYGAKAKAESIFPDHDSGGPGNRHGYF